MDGHKFFIGIIVVSATRTEFKNIKRFEKKMVKVNKKGDLTSNNIVEQGRNGTIKLKTLTKDINQPNNHI